MLPLRVMDFSKHTYLDRSLEPFTCYLTVPSGFRSMAPVRVMYSNDCISVEPMRP